MKYHVLSMIATCVALVLTGCPLGGSADVTGHWDGTISGELQCGSNSQTYSGSFSCDLTQSGTSVTGGWSARISKALVTGDCSGTVQGNRLNIRFEYPAGDCAYVLTATASGDSLNGNYVTSGYCWGCFEAGQMNLSR